MESAPATVAEPEPDPVVLQKMAEPEPEPVFLQKITFSFSEKSEMGIKVMNCTTVFRLLEVTEHGLAHGKGMLGGDEIIEVNGVRCEDTETAELRKRPLQLVVQRAGITCSRATSAHV